MLHLVKNMHKVTLAKVFGLFLSVFFASAFSVQALETGYVTSDAERFAQIYEVNDGKLTTEILQELYLDNASLGVEIFTEYRIRSAANLLMKIEKYPEIYRKTVEYCLPQALAFRDEAFEIRDAVANIVGSNEAADIYIVFGAMNSGGTVGSGALVIGLEILCRDAGDNFTDLLKAFVAHETTHVYQTSSTSDGTLLWQAVMEGTAEFVAELVAGRSLNPAIDEYAKANEARLWTEFKKDMDGTEYKGWMYNGANVSEGVPADLGYWIGSRIARSYYNQTQDKAAAIDDLLQLTSAKEILTASGYSPE
ncbi:MAG: hypothetical protein KAR62_05465 [Sphingomonadales bacterium]|nr:hypothetical protein [Sphingomonadales bacterium]